MLLSPLGARPRCLLPAKLMVTAYALERSYLAAGEKPPDRDRARHQQQDQIKNIKLSFSEETARSGLKARHGLLHSDWGGRLLYLEIAVTALTTAQSTASGHDHDGIRGRIGPASAPPTGSSWRCASRCGLNMKSPPCPPG